MPGPPVLEFSSLALLMMGWQVPCCQLSRCGACIHVTLSALVASGGLAAVPHSLHCPPPYVHNLLPTTIKPRVRGLELETAIMDRSTCGAAGHGKVN